MLPSPAIGNPSDELVRNSDQLRLLIEVSEAIATHRDLTALCRDLAKRLPAIVPFEFIALFLHDAEKQVMRVDLLGTADADSIPPGLELPVDGSFSGIAFTTQRPAIVQNRFHAATGYDTGIRAFCRAEGLVYQSFWTLSANPRLLGSATLLALASAHARTPAQILFRYLIQRGVVPLTGTTSLDHLRESLAVFDFALDARDAADIDATLRESTG